MDTVAPRKGFDVVAYLKLFRFPLVFTAIADSATGYLVSFGGYESKPRAFQTLGLLAISSGCLYAFGMALNDIADRHRILKIAPGRVLPSGRISVAAAVAAAIGVLLVSAISLYFAEYGRGSKLQRFLVWGLVVAGIVTYDFLVKLPPVMGLVRACNFLLGVATGGLIRLVHDDHSWPYHGTYYYFEIWHLILIALPEFVYVTALTYVSTLEEGALNRKKLWVGAGFMMGAALIMASWVPVAGMIWRSIKHEDLQGEVTGFRMPWLAVLAATFLAHWIFKRAWQAKDKKGVMLLVRDGIGGIILLNATMLLSLGLVIEGALVATLILPAVLSVAIFKRLA